MALAVCVAAAASLSAWAEDVPIFITIGQSNADGSAFCDADEDARMDAWFSSDQNPQTMKMWYRSTQLQFPSTNDRGERPRWATDGAITDAQPGWMDLWWRNDQRNGRTAMNVTHADGTYSEAAQMRRGMEPSFGMNFVKKFPGSELYMLKLGISGSMISAWASEGDNVNWTYFFNNIYKPAVTDLIAQGKRPVLAGVWWMQGCGDNARPEEYYEENLRELVRRCQEDLGFPGGKVYVGHVVKPGEAKDFAGASTQFGEGVRAAQDKVASDTPGVEIIDTSDLSFQYERNLGGYLHYDAKGVNKLGEKLANRVAQAGPMTWVPYSTPGRWHQSGDGVIFIPSIGQPKITYTRNGDTVTATLTYPTWTETKTYKLKS